MSKSTTINTEILKVKEIEGRGRSLIISQSLKAGEIILRDSPILIYPAFPLIHGQSPNFCFHCFRKLHHHQQGHNSTSTSNGGNCNNTVLPCPSCSYHALFCSPNCQSMALASSHSPWVCQALNSIRYSSSSSHLPQDPDFKIQLNFLVFAYNLALFSPPHFQILLSVQGDSPTTLSSETLALHSFISSIIPPQISTGFTFSPELTAALLAKDKQNAFGLMEPLQGNINNNDSSERTVRAYAIYPKASFFNHDCLPNACRFDYVDAGNPGDLNNTDIIIRAIHDIPEGREICLSYFPVNWNYQDRQKRLMDDYGFTCDCDRCKVEANWKDEDGEDGDDDNMEPGDDRDDAAMGGSDEEFGEENDFPHAYFFVKYVCDRENCGGTLAPLPPSPEGLVSGVLECNVCGQLRKEEEDMDGDDEDGVMLDE